MISLNHIELRFDDGNGVPLLYSPLSNVKVGEVDAPALNLNMPAGEIVHINVVMDGVDSNEVCVRLGEEYFLQNTLRISMRYGSAKVQIANFIIDMDIDMAQDSIYVDKNDESDGCAEYASRKRTMKTIELQIKH